MSLYLVHEPVICYINLCVYGPYLGPVPPEPWRRKGIWQSSRNCYFVALALLRVIQGDPSVMSCDMKSSNPDSLSVKYSLIFYSVSLFIQLAYMKLHSLRSRLPDLRFVSFNMPQIRQVHEGGGLRGPHP